jgi:uncharacterized membrane-anchored protein
MQLARALLIFALFAGGLSRAAEKAAADKSAPSAGAEAAPKPPTREEALARAGVKMTAGPATVKLGKAAELKLPEGFQFVGQDSLDRFYELTQNTRSGNEVGVVMAPNYMLYFDYDEIGYVKDEDKDKLDAEKLMKSMGENQDAANEARKERGWDQLKLKGWATAPHYDSATNNLKWAINLASSRDGFNQVFINESIRLLGRKGVMNVTLVSGTDAFKAAEVDADKLLAKNFSYVSGEKYAEFKQGDKVAAYGLSALVLGGGAVMAAKLGLFAKLGVLLGKAWKAIVFGLIAFGALLKKLWNKITGSRPQEPEPPVA